MKEKWRKLKEIATTFRNISAPKLCFFLFFSFSFFSFFLLVVRGLRTLFARTQAVNPQHIIMNLNMLMIFIDTDNYEKVQQTLNFMSITTKDNENFQINVNVKIIAKKIKLFLSYIPDKVVNSINSLPVQKTPDFRHFGSTFIPNGKVKDKIPIWLAPVRGTYSPWNQSQNKSS